MAHIGETASHCLSGSYQPNHSPAAGHQTGQQPGQQGQPSPGDSSSQYESQHSPFTDMTTAVGAVQEFHAEFITHPINYNQPGRGSPGARIPASPEHSHSPSSASPSNTLPSFIDTYTPSVVTIEQRPFGAEAEYESRLRHQKHPQQQQQQQQQHPASAAAAHHHQMTVKFHLKTEAPDYTGPGHRSSGHSAGHAHVFSAPHTPQYQDQYQPPSHTAAGDHSDGFYLKKEPSHTYSATPGSSPSPSPATSSLQPEFVDFFHHPPSSQSNLTTLTNYIPFNTDFSGHPGHMSLTDQNCPKFEADIESLNRVRRTILAQPQPM